jgi:hypothetical protein
MKLLISGGRQYRFNQSGQEYLNKLYFTHQFSSLVNGKAKGVDEAAEKWANLKEIPVQPFYADWNKHGKKAGILRNQQMVDQLTKSDLFIAFPGGRGTDDAFRRAEKAGVQIIDLRERKDLVEEIK